MIDARSRLLRSGWLLPALLSCVFLGNGLNDIFRNSAVADELGGHMAAGYLYLSTGIYNGGVANFPLGHLIIALPVHLLTDSWELFSAQHLVLFRLPVLLMGLLLGLAVYRFASALLGSAGGLTALALYCFSPNILAHATLATLDLPLTFFVFLTVFALWAYVRRPGLRGMILLSLALGLALATKIQAFLLIPLILVILFLSVAGGKLRPDASWLLLAVIPYLLINLVCSNFPPLSSELLPPVYVHAFRIKLAHATGKLGPQQTAYLFGHYSSSGWWYYFPLAMLFKTPLPTLILLVIGLWERISRDVLLFVLLPAASFLAAAMASSINIGLRHILIIYPFLFIIAAGGALKLWKSRPGKIPAVLLGLACIGQACFIAPHHLSFFNLLAGGPGNGHRILIDSNLDWGQNDLFLERYIEKRGLDLQIDPDPFHPTTGTVAVNVNAFYGIYGGCEEKAYAWLKQLRPVDEVACTWLVYEVPENLKEVQFEGNCGHRDVFRLWAHLRDPERRDEALERGALYLGALNREYAVIHAPAFRFPLAKACIAMTDYGTAIDEFRRLVRDFPRFKGPFGLGCELMVRWKLGMLKFEGREYLDGPQCRSDLSGTPPDVREMLRLSRYLGAAPLFAKVHLGLGAALEARDNFEDAALQYRLALRFRPGDPEAFRGLERLREHHRSGRLKGLQVSGGS